MWLRVNNIHGKIRDGLSKLSISKGRASSAKIIYVRAKQQLTIKTIICNDIFTSLRRKKVQGPAKQFKELFSLCPNHFR